MISWILDLPVFTGKFESYATFPKISECTLCEEIVVWAKEYLSEEGTTDEIEDAAKEMCNELPSGYVDECLEVVNGYLPVRFQFIFTISFFFSQIRLHIFEKNSIKIICYKMRTKSLRILLLH